MSKEGKPQNVDIPEFWTLFPPGMLTFLAVIMLTLVSGGATLIVLLGVPESIYFKLSPEKIYFTGLCISAALCIPNFLVVRGYNRFAMKIIRWQLLVFIVISIPFVLTELKTNAIWTGVAALVGSGLALTLTYTISYQMTPHYYEKLINWKKERDKLRDEIVKK